MSLPDYDHPKTIKPMTRNNVVGFTADLHGTGGWYILADGTKVSSGQQSANLLLASIQSQYLKETNAHRFSELKFAWRGVKRHVIEALIRKFSAFNHKRAVK